MLGNVATDVLKRACAPLLLYHSANVREPGLEATASCDSTSLNQR
jgi:hypothetical protein